MYVYMFVKLIIVLRFLIFYSNGYFSFDNYNLVDYFILILVIVLGKEKDCRVKVKVIMV